MVSILVAMYGTIATVVVGGLYYAEKQARLEGGSASAYAHYISMSFCYVANLCYDHAVPHAKC